MLVHLQDAVADVVQEIAVVSHHQQGHSATLQVVFQPLDHVDVKVVGRLIENEHLRLVNQEPSQGDTFHLTATQLFDRLIVVGDFELGKNLLEALLVVPCRVGIHRLDCGCHGIAVARAKGLLIVMDSARPRVIAVQTGVKHGVCLSEVGQLWQVTHAQVVAVDDSAAVCRGDAGKDVE